MKWNKRLRSDVCNGFTPLCAAVIQNKHKEFLLWVRCDTRFSNVFSHVSPVITFQRQLLVTVHTAFHYSQMPQWNVSCFSENILTYNRWIAYWIHLLLLSKAPLVFQLHFFSSSGRKWENSILFTLIQYLLTFQCELYGWIHQLNRF